MDPPSRVQSFYHSAMMPIPWLCTLTEEEEGALIGKFIITGETGESSSLTDF